MAFGISDANALDAISIYQAESSATPLSGRFEYLIDKTGTLGLDDILQNHEKDFSPLVERDLEFSVSHSAVWIRFAVNFSKYHDKYWFVLQDYEHVQVMDLFYKNNGQYKHLQINEEAPENKNGLKIHNFAFKIPVDGNNISTYYVRYFPNGHAVKVYLSWADTDGFIGYLAKTHLEEGVFFGGLSVMLIYNGFLFLYLRDKTYLLYVYYLGAFIGTFLYIDGFMPILFGMSREKEKVFSMLPFLAVNGMVIFGRHFLNLKDTRSFTERCLICAQWIVLAGAFSPYILPRGRSWDLVNVLIITVIPMLIASGVSQCRRYKPARYYTLGWAVFGLTVCMLSLKSLLILPPSFGADDAVKFGAMWEAILFSFALAFRFRLNEQEAKIKVDNLLTNVKSALEREKEALIRKAQFIAAVNHELRTPLQSLTGSIEAFAAHVDLPNDDARLLKLRRAAGQISSQMRDIGEYSRLEAGALVPRETEFHLAEILYGIQEDLSECARSKGIDLRVEQDRSELALFGDRDRIRQIITNLVENSIKFSDEGGVTVACSIGNESDVVGPDTTSRVLTIDVVDSGKGISSDELEKIFEPFWQGRNKQKESGSGLGLAIVKRLTDLLGGNISVDSTRGKGSRFTVRLPVKEMSI
ncbi:sensor histidine kinase [Caballeronia calidae]|nr:sensor histidine kinase [Caballeronia calidae]